MIHELRDISLLALALVGSVGSLAGQGTSAHQLPLSGTLGANTFSLTEHAIRDAEYSGVSAIIVEFDMDGDDVDLALEIVEMIEQTPVSVYAYVNGRAWNAAALVALACDSIYMHPEATLGGHGDTSLQLSVETDSAEISLSDVFARLAVARGAAGAVGRAMVDSTVGIPEVGASGSRLAIDASRAVGLGLAVAELDDVEALLEIVGLSGVRVEEVNEEWLSTTVTIQNHNWNNINIFVRLSGGAKIRLGTVTSNGSADFSVPGHLLLRTSYIQVIAEVIGSDETAATEIAQVVPGLVIEWNLENVLRHSTYFIWVR